MNLEQAIKKYEVGLREDVIWSYKDADEYIYINEEDEDLQKWRIKMPEPPDWAKLKNFGKHARDQVFVYEQMPQRLENLVNEIKVKIDNRRNHHFSEPQIERMFHKTLWDTLRMKKRDYEDEIEWIQAQWYYLLNGQWQMIHGKPVYIDGWNFAFLNYWPLEGTGKLPDYRQRDMKWFHAQRYAYTTTETVDYDEILDENGGVTYKIALLEDGTLRMRDMGHRTSFGTNNLKGRRVGETSKTACINYFIAIINFDVNCGLQGNLESTASDIYEEKLLYAFNKLPFFFVPMMPTNNNSTGLFFAGLRSKGGLNSKVGFATTSRKEFYDQKRLDFIQVEEAGKTKLEDCIVRHGVLKRCVAEGALIKGLMIYCSTAEDMDHNSGQKFEALSYDSFFEERLINGQTKSGLLVVYFPYYEAYAGFINKWGEPIINTPTEEEIPSMAIIKRNQKGEIMGAKEYLESIEEDLKKKGALRELAQHQRQHPNRFRECFALAIAGSNFNIDILKDRITELKIMKDKKIIIGDFYWLGAKYESKVAFIENPQGKWYVSRQLGSLETNQSINYDGFNRMPRFDSGFILSADAYRFDETDTFRESQGGIAVFEMYNPTLDGDKENAKDYVSERFVATYLGRELTKELYAEEVLKAALYYNALVYPEINVTIVQDVFLKLGYRGYLHFDVDDNGYKKKNCGFNTAGPIIKQKMFTYVDTWINLHAHKTYHRRLLEECLLIRGPKYTKDFDLFVSMAGALLGAHSKYTEYIRRFSDADGVEVGSFWGKSESA